MDAERTVQCQNQIVSTVIQSISPGWDHILVNIEIDIIDGEQMENCLMLSFVERGVEWIPTSEQLPYSSFDQFDALRDLTKSAEFGAWRICTLQIDSTGKYRFSFSHKPPLRLNGDHGDAAMFAHYVPESL